MMASKAINNLNLDDSCIPWSPDRNRNVEFNLEATRHWPQYNEFWEGDCLNRTSGGILMARKRQGKELNYARFPTSFY